MTENDAAFIRLLVRAEDLLQSGSGVRGDWSIPESKILALAKEVNQVNKLIYGVEITLESDKKTVSELVENSDTDGP